MRGDLVVPSQLGRQASPRTPGSRRGKSGSPTWTDDDTDALNDPYDSLQIESVTSSLGRQWQQQRRRRGRACEPDLPPSPITPLTGRRGEACLPSCAAAAASPVRTRQGPRAVGTIPSIGAISNDGKTRCRLTRGCGATVRARRGGRCLAEPADSDAGAGCGGRRWVTPIARELPVTISNVTIADQASRTSAGVPSGRRSRDTC